MFVLNSQKVRTARFMCGLVTVALFALPTIRHLRKMVRLWAASLVTWAVVTSRQPLTFHLYAGARRLIPSQHMIFCRLF